MKKLILSVAILTLGVLSVQAQRGSEDKTVKISIGAEGALPMGDLKTTSKFGFGGSAQAEIEVSDNIAVTLSAGYLTFSGKIISIPVSFDPITMQPIYGDYKVPSINIIPVLIALICAIKMVFVIEKTIIKRSLMPLSNFILVNIVK